MIETWSLKDSFLIFYKLQVPTYQVALNPEAQDQALFSQILLIAPRPSAAELTLYPSDFKLNSRVVLRSGSSSTIKLFLSCPNHNVTKCQIC
ncbi:MAG: hypothetical protein CM15mP86_05530 [Gammaproteobacteria bacterium]|nr:MAG: hypothetical protein CM15mP86_05530 [Gammaproteobacteria bacterium]